MDVLLKEEFIAAMHRFKKVGRSFLPCCGINMGEFFVMERISRDMPCSSTDISASEMQNHPQFTKPAVSQMLNSLEKKGYVHREIDKNDRRRIVVTLTADGEEVLKQGKTNFNNLVNQAIARFGEENTRQFISLVARLTDITEDLKDISPQDDKKEEHLD
ncbi:transcriptional regulator [Sphaerochaeta pleomorpha str. Grapes]|uniref:Transcriptional regulator n=1 Tax=Sphaerochaeta pleomorpha (strain ATCC BAA-1885 / DSM 22778 / Grapes) TaxID=158190 RepID=G8QUJ1_SPHPG|nr:MarR family transcriptional regulator [Sphaerochaeta pleomorpha]AEV29224.1 transcriptional regulator [Sphaerochaeta pleomorpha str. Grapes]